MLEQDNPSLIEKLTTNFYQWEKRGRGWQVYNYPVEVEPLYEPFFFHYIPQTKAITDDARKPTFISSLIDRFSKKSQPNELLPAPENYEEISPIPFDADSPIKEIKVSLSLDQELPIEVMEQFILNLSYCSLPISFEIIGTPKSISVQLTCREPDHNMLRQQIIAHFPEVVLYEEKEYLQNLWDKEAESLVVDFGLSQEFMRPLRIFKTTEADSLTGVIGALHMLKDKEVGILQVLFQPARHPWAESIVRSVTDFEGNCFFADAPEMLSLAKEKVQRPLFGAVVRIAAQSSSESRTWEIMRSLAGGLAQLSRPESNELIPLINDSYSDVDHEECLLSRQTYRSGMLLNSEELVSLVHLPEIAYHTPKLHAAIKATKEAPAIAISQQLVLGENYHQGKKSIVGLSREQRLRHAYVIGATGTGKSTLLLNLIKQDIEQGYGVGVLDPHGDLIDHVLSSIPEHRLQDVILFDPSDTEYPIGFNILSAHSDVERNVLSSDLTAVFRRLSTTWGDQMNSVLGNAILAFLESDKGGSLSDLRRFLIEKEFRASFLETVKDKEIVYYWKKEFPLLRGNPQVPILTRLDTFLRPKIIRNIVCQEKSLNFENILDSRKIFLAKIGQGLIGEENAYLLGSLLVSKIHQCVMARQAKEISQREDFYLYIDEFHNFITPSMAAILSGARKYRLGLTLAHQELYQLWHRDPEVANSVIANPGTRICFRLGDFDAQKLAEGFSSFEKEDLQNLGVGEAVCRIERPEYDFNIKVSLPEEIRPDIARQQQESIIALSRQKYAIRKEEIETKLNKDKELVVEPPEPVQQPIREEKVVRKAPSKEAEAPIKKKEAVTEPPVFPSRIESEHRYLQTLIKRMAEEKGYRAIIEQPTPDGQGKVDVSLEYDGKKIACEIALTTTDEHEFQNIEKCIAAGYEKVILCSQEKRNLEKLKDLVSTWINKANQGKVLFLQPEEIYFFLEEEAAKNAGKEERIKGYRVKVQYKPTLEKEKITRREMIGQVILSALKRLKGKK